VKTGIHFNLFTRAGTFSTASQDLTPLCKVSPAGFTYFLSCDNIELKKTFVNRTLSASRKLRDFRVGPDRGIVA
jgi:hypothetical protein